MSVVERVRLYATTLRTKSVPLSSMIPLMLEAADEIESLRAELERKSEAIQKLWRERDEARAEAEALRADAERYRWLRLNGYVEVKCESPRHNGWNPVALDAAIDSARSA